MPSFETLRHIFKILPYSAQKLQSARGKVFLVQNFRTLRKLLLGENHPREKEIQEAMREE
jgi:hypothetical protein